MYCIYMYTSVWQRVKTLLWYNCCQIENIHGIISVHFPVCLNISHRDANFHCITTKNKINLYILSQPYTCSTYKHSHNLYTSWSHLSYLKGTSNATATKLNSFFRVFEPSNTQHRKSTPFIIMLMHSIKKLRTKKLLKLNVREWFYKLI